jgi:large subunit ribosomal protein L17
MASSLIKHKRIFTTVAKAKALRTFVEPLITKSKNDTTHSRRVVFSYLRDKEAVTELFREVSAKVAERPGGYTRIIKTGKRLGDNAEMCMIELVDFNENLLQEKSTKESAAKKRSRRGGTTKKKETAPVAEAKKEAKKEVKEETAAVAEAEVAEPAAEDIVEASTDEAPESPSADAPDTTEAEGETPEAEEK